MHVIRKRVGRVCLHHGGETVPAQPQRLKSLSDLAQFRDRWSANEPSAAPPSSPPAVESAWHAHSPHVCRGWVAFLTGRKAGFVSDFGAGVLTTVRTRAAAFVFRDRASLSLTVNLALGINAELYTVRIFPAIGSRRCGHE